MTRTGPRSFRTALSATVVAAFTASLLGCASLGPSTTVEVPDVKSVMGTWKGILYRTGFEPDYVTLTIHEDGSYDLTSANPGGSSQGKGKIVLKDGRLFIEGEKGRGVGTLLRNPAGDLLMNVDATLEDNSNVTAKLSLSR